MSDTAGDILTGALDSELVAIEKAVTLRRKILAEGQSFLPGTRVRIINIRPKYMEGKLATVKYREGSKVVVDLDYSIGRFIGKDLRVPVTCVEVVA